MNTDFDHQELQERIALNFVRLRDDPYYQIERVFSPANYDWYGDKEGRALLAFVSHYKIHGHKIPCMDDMLAHIQEKTNEKLFFGPLANEIIHEQQLSGHSWLLRGFCEYYEQFHTPVILEMIRSICDNLYLPTKGRYHTYPTIRTHQEGGNVSGNTVGESQNWKLSSDIGCAFMSIDGLSHAYSHLKDPLIQDLLDEMIDVYLNIDKLALKVQTHCTLTAARGMIRMYHTTNDAKYLEGAKSIYKLYTMGGGMTYTYQNVNWWGRNDTWTEPCAIVDSLILACQLYRIEGLEEYKRTAARIYHNGLASAQRANGGAGTDHVVTRAEGGNDTLFSRLYEAPFCCTMRLAEGLWFIHENCDMLGAMTSGSVTRQQNGVYADGDILYAEISHGDSYLTQPPITIDGHKLHPLLKYYKIPKQDMEAISQKIIWENE